MDVITFIFKDNEDAVALLNSNDLLTMIRDREIDVLFDSLNKEICFKIFAKNEDNKRVYRGICDLVEYYTYYD